MRTVGSLKRAGCFFLVLILGFLFMGCASAEGFSFEKVIIGGMGRIIAVDSDGKIWEANPDRDKETTYIDRTYSSDPMAWENVVDVSAGRHSILALLDDGTVKYDNSPLDKLAPDAPYPLYDLSDWDSIVEISCGAYHVAGLQGDGSVVVASEENAVWPSGSNVD